MRRLLFASVLALGIAALSGCTTALVGGAIATGAHIIHDRRPTTTVLNDRNLQLSVIRAIDADQALASHNHIRVVVYNGVIVLIGEVASDAARAKAGQLASGFIGARKVVNQLDIAPETGFWSSRRDDTLTAKVKTSLLGVRLSGFDPSRVNITTAHGNVYVLGLLTHAEGSAVITAARNTHGVNKVVNLIEYLDAPPPGTPPPPPPPPATSVATPAPTASAATTYPLTH